MNAPTFEACVMACLDNDVLMTEYARLTGEMRRDERTPIDKAIDAAAGKSAVDEAEARRFFAFVRDCIWLPLVTRGGS